MGYDAELDRANVHQNLQVTAGANLDLNGTWKISGTQVTATAAQLNNLAGEAPTWAELACVDDVTAGLVAASKAAVVDASKNIGDFNNLDCVNLDCGASGTAGTVDIFPSTATSGKWILSCTPQTGDTAVTLKPAAMGQATTVTIPDPGTTGAYLVMTTASLSLAEADVLQDVVAGTAAASKAAVLGANKNLDEFHTAALYLGANAGTQVTATATELDNLASVAAGTASASKAAVLGTNKELDEFHTAALYLGANAGTQVTATATELNTLASITAGTVAASGAVVASADKDVGDFRNLDCVNLDAGASGTAGTVDIFPTTATSGKWTLTCTAQAGDTTVETTVAAMGQATVLTVPDPGAAAASFVLTEGTQTVGGAKTFSSAIKTSANVGAAGTAVVAVESGDGTVHQTVLTVTYTGDNDYDMADGNDDAGKLAYTFPEGRILVIGAVADLNCTSPAPVNEVQALTVSATEGTYTLTFSGNTTGNIAYDANAATITTELEALGTIGTGNVLVSGEGPFAITYQGDLAGKNVDLAVASAGATVELTTDGSGGMTDSYYVGVGSAEATNNDGDLTSTEQNVIAKTTVAHGADKAGHGIDGAASVYLDGTSSAATLFVNVAVPTASVTADGSTVAITGTITVSWIKLGDY